MKSIRNFLLTAINKVILNQVVLKKNGWIIDNGHDVALHYSVVGVGDKQDKHELNYKGYKRQKSADLMAYVGEYKMKELWCRPIDFPVIQDRKNDYIVCASVGRNNKIERIIHINRFKVADFIIPRITLHNNTL